MRALFQIVVGLIVVVAVLLGVGYVTLRRPDIPYAELEQHYADAQSRYVDLPGDMRVHYRDQGAREGRVLLMIHGYGASLHTWEPWVERLSRTYRIITLDLPGHGLTRAPGSYRASPRRYADVVEAFAQAQHLEHFTIVGSSMGGAVAWNYTLLHPQRIDGLVLVGSAGWPAPNNEAPAVFQLLSNPLVGPIFRDLDNRQIVSGLLHAAFVNQTLVTDDMMQRYLDLSRAPGHREIVTTIDGTPTATPDQMARINTPTLVMHGEGDNLVRVADGRRFAATIPGSELVIYPNVGHIPMEEIADQSAASLTNFLERHPPAQSATSAAAPATP